MREHPRDHHATPLTVEEHARAVSCTRCPDRAQVAACWTFDGARRQVMCRRCATRWAAPYRVALPEPGAELLAEPKKLRLARPSLPQREPQPMPLHLAVDSVLEYADPRPGPELDHTVQLLGLIAEGLSDQQIGVRLNRTAGKTKSLLASLLGELDAVNRPHAIHIGHQRGLLCDPTLAGEPPMTVEGQRAVVLTQLAEGRTRKEIGEHLGLGGNAVDHLVNKLVARLGSGGAPVIVHQAHRHGLLACACTRAPSCRIGVSGHEHRGEPPCAECAGYIGELVAAGLAQSTVEAQR